ncbi:complex I NDUFA9 subunit family protein [Pseudoroseicyclus tamaricis]|uniref:Complex I NDUFA9 subunit family protein n=1 Tax=Pseudoroseicyclus tamaricis TaxID=2705421 RepID=A0A6B2JWL9_9RHOB|nr:complex I NDUFA9 subunit family protein [Pseudoroseicyclus tamaricis]NDV02897.1 complex I NDUFA9 subunit family protein [Pseudoroseicyclus tamaricis]
MAGLVTIFGGSGFLGRHIARRLAKEGWRVRVAVREVAAAGFVRQYGVVGQVMPVFCNIRDDDSVAAALAGADAAINCVGILADNGRNTLKAINEDGAARIARVSKEMGIKHLVHLSGLGADADSESSYLRTKADGEQAVREIFPGAMILRPAPLFGPDDTFFNRLGNMARMLPVIPLPKQHTRLQPVYVDDVAAAAALGASGRAPGGTYALGGPEVMTQREVMEAICTLIRRRRVLFGLPDWLARPVAWAGGIVQVLSLGIIKAPITSDELRALSSDSVVPEGAKGFAELGLTPTAMEVVLPSYMWRFRPSGQYLAIKDSAKGLRKS